MMGFWGVAPAVSRVRQLQTFRLLDAQQKPQISSSSIFCKLAVQTPNVTDSSMLPPKNSPDLQQSREQAVAKVGWTWRRHC